MRGFFRVTNIVLLVLALAACGFCGYMWKTDRDVAPETFETEAQALRTQAETYRENARAAAEAAEAALEERMAAMQADLRSSGDEGVAAADRLDALRTGIEEKTARLEELRQTAEAAERIEERAMEKRRQYAETIRQLEDKIVAGESDVKICYWTLDDGPTYLTQQFLDAAEEYGVHVTFFTAREANDSAYGDDPAVERELLRQEILGGHSIGNHTNSHQYGVYGNVYGQGIESFAEQVRLQDEWVLECTGIKPDIFRFPGGSAFGFARLPKAEMEAVLAEQGYVWIDWSCDIFDNAKANPSAQAEAANAVYEVETMDIAVLLSHDWNANTLEAFKRAVPTLKEAGYVFLPLFSQSWTIGNTVIQFS